MAKIYAVKKGRKTGLFYSWDECKEQVNGYKGAQYKSFSSIEEANAFLEEKKQAPLEGLGLIAYVDGSYNIKTKEYGYGCILIEGGKVIQEFYDKGNHPDYVSMRNVAGEILGSEKAIQYAIENKYQYICIYYDYEGIEKWADKIWKANKVGTIAYQQFIEESKKSLSIVFTKVLAHSGDYYNEQADKLAKKAVGIK